MTERFNPDTHVFGMAYTDKEGRIIYPTRMDEVTCRAIIEPYKPWPTYYDFFNSDITRAPEHDLVKRSDIVPEGWTMVPIEISQSRADIVGVPVSFWKHLIKPYVIAPKPTGDT